MKSEEGMEWTGDEERREGRRREMGEEEGRNCHPSTSIVSL